MAIAPSCSNSIVPCSVTTDTKGHPPKVGLPALARQRQVSRQHSFRSNATQADQTFRNTPKNVVNLAIGALSSGIVLVVAQNIINVLNAYLII